MSVDMSVDRLINVCRHVRAHRHALSSSAHLTHFMTIKYYNIPLSIESESSPVLPTVLDSIKDSGSDA